MAMELVKAEGFAVDASVMEANASRCHGVPRDEIDWTDAQKQQRAVAEYLDALDAEVKRQAQAESASDNGMDEGGAERQPPHRKVPKVISPSDPGSAWTAKANER